MEIIYKKNDSGYVTLLILKRGDPAPNNPSVMAGEDIFVMFKGKVKNIHTTTAEIIGEGPASYLWTQIDMFRREADFLQAILERNNVGRERVTPRSKKG